jgi:hypothetical protein
MAGLSQIRPQALHPSRLAGGSSSLHLSDNRHPRRWAPDIHRSSRRPSDPQGLMMRLRLVLACLLAGTVSGCGGASPSSASSTANLGASASRSVGWTSGSPSPTATPIPGRAVAWTNQAVAVYPTPGLNGTAAAHLGANFPLLLTLETADVDGTPWCQAIWQTPGRHETGWLPSSAVTLDKPDGEASAAFDALDTTFAAYLDSFGTRVGVEVKDLTRGLTYAYNADLAYIIASTSFRS